MMRLISFYFLLLSALLLSTKVAAGIIINEFAPNPYGSDQSSQTIEIVGDAELSFTDLTLISIEADNSQNLGSINNITSGVSGQFDNNGLHVFDVDDLENPSFILILLQGSFDFDMYLNQNNDLDTNNDGLFDDSTWFDFVLDAVGVFDSNSDHNSSFDYLQQIGGTHFKYSGDEPKLMFRDGISKTFWAINDPAGNVAYDAFGNTKSFDDFNQTPELSSFGEVNPYVMLNVNEPTTLLLSLLILLVGIKKGKTQLSCLNRNFRSETKLKNKSSWFSSGHLSTC